MLACRGVVCSRLNYFVLSSLIELTLLEMNLSMNKKNISLHTTITFIFISMLLSIFPSHTMADDDVALDAGTRRYLDRLYEDKINREADAIERKQKQKAQEWSDERDKERAKEKIDNERAEEHRKEVAQEKRRQTPGYIFFAILPLLSALLFGVSVKFNEGIKLGWMLGLGILLLPLFFSWVTLKKGYDNSIKITSFTHLLISYGASYFGGSF